MLWTCITARDWVFLVKTEIINFASTMENGIRQIFIFHRDKYISFYFKMSYMVKNLCYFYLQDPSPPPDGIFFYTLLRKKDTMIQQSMLQ